MLVNNMSPPDLAVFIGNTLDHFDTSIYIFLAPIMAPIFFPAHDPIIQLILAYSILSTSIITRPLGATVFGAIACSKGPMFALSYSLIGLAITTLLLGCLPCYKSIGYIAPISLIFIMMLQGICASGESAIAMLYIAENKTQIHAIKNSCFYNISTMLGIILASIASAIVINSQQINGWRICFWIGGTIGLVGVFLRFYYSSSIHYQHQKTSKSFDFRVLWQHKANILKIALAIGFGHITYSIPFIFFNSFVPMITEINLATMIYLNNFLLIFDLITLLIIGRIIAHYNPTKIMLFASVMLLVTIIPIFGMLKNSSILTVTIIRCWIVFWGVVFACPVNVWCEKLLNNLPEKYFLMGISGAIGASVIGKTMTPVCFYLWYTTKMPIAPALYLVALMLLTIIAILFNANKVCCTMQNLCSQLGWRSSVGRAADL